MRMMTTRMMTKEVAMKRMSKMDERCISHDGG